MHWGGLCSEPGKGPGSISPGRVWLSLLPDPAGSFEEVVNAKEDEKHMGEMEVRRPYSKQKRKHINRASGPPLCTTGLCLDIVFPHLWCSVFWHYAAASHLSSPASCPSAVT